jgi:Type IV secretory pathway, VirB3-like protein
MRAHLIEGYEAEIYQALWKRPAYLGVPKMWAMMWLVVCLGGVLVALTKGGVQWLLLPAIVWGIGHGVLLALTLWDEQFDDVLIAKVTRRIKPYYTP